MESYKGGKEKVPSITLERASAEDVDTYLELERSVAGSSTYLATINQNEALSEIEKDVVYFIRDGDKIAGSVTYEMKSSDHAYISGLVIHPDFQGRSIGKTAMEKILEELKDIPTVDLVTHPDNARAIALYESLGFTVGERVENYFDDGEPRVVMTLSR